MKDNRPSYALAASRGDFEPMRSRLENKTGARFVLIRERAKLTVDFLKSQSIARVFLPHWSYIIPAAVYDGVECIIFHMTDLPFGRGGSPLQNLIARRHVETKISALRCVRELDAGPIYLKAPLKLDGSAEDIFSRAYGIIENMIVELIKTNPAAVPQKGPITVFKRRTPAESRLDDCGSLRELYDRIRMLDAEGYPHAFFDAGPFRIEFRGAAFSSDGVTASARITMTHPPSREASDVE